ncbi:MAG TPA: hypothetical protein ENI09_01685 [candidate division WWE3 bacterium]|uniref:Lactamase n=1 Tax=candidate division WWE3 bacterium TaxID=2053526 RepID=A0A7C1T2W6_UNCKA|nr:hypothetical protein [candidate division WWE3 bacterium]
MRIRFLGHSSFEIEAGGVTVVTDPFDSDKVGLPFPKVGADLVLSSHDHLDHNAVDAVAGEPFAVSGPGEYEVGGVKVRGFETFHDDKEGKERGKNTVYLFQVEGITLCHLGDLGHVLGEKVAEEIGELDVLFVPVGGVYTINPEQAAKVAAQLESKYIVPMHYRVEGMAKTFDELQPISTFLEEMGVESPEPKKELSVSKKSLPEEPEVVVLEI